MSDDVDVVIVGGGAAGLAAAARLGETDLTVRLLEARERLGGRAWTELVGGWPCDLGCGWLHSADQNSFVAIAERAGFDIDRTPPHWTRQSGNANFSREDQAAFGEALGMLESRIEAAADRGEDVAVSALMDPGGRWNPLLDAFSSYYNGAEFDRISTTDYSAYEDSGVNWRAPAGYGALIAGRGVRAGVRLGCPVRRIDRSGAQLRIETDQGALTASSVVLTIPTSLIADGTLRFAPDLPALREAAEGLPLGLADKVLLAVSDPEAWPSEGHLFGDPGRTATGSYHLRPFGRPLIEAFLGGRNALALEDDQAAIAFVIEELAGVVGTSVRARLKPLAVTAWARDPWSRGSYSHALPGRAAARRALAASHDPRIVLAGEAVSANWFSTAHGAALTGIAAAESVLERLGRGI